MSQSEQHPHDEAQLKRELAEQEHRDAELAQELRAGERREGELAEELRELEEHEKVETVVVFPLAGKKPFKAEDRREEPTTALLREAMTYFGVVDDETTTYHLSHDGERVAPEATVGQLAGRARELKVKLVKDIFQG
jgi:hypothetical protein